MKKGLVVVVLLSLGLLFHTPISAQNLNKTNKIESFKKNSVKYIRAEAFSDGSGVWLEWETEFERGNLGFYVYRVVGDSRELVSSSLIPGMYLQMRDAQISGQKYSTFDEKGDLNSYYIIESLNINGEKQSINPVFPKYVGDLTAVAGSSSESLKIESEKANPFILRNENILPKDLQSEVEGNRPQADATTQRRVAAQPGVKIGVKKEGFYRVSRAELQTGGFDVNAPSAFWQLYKDGVEQAIIVAPNGDYIEFYGNGIDTRDTDTQIYFLTVGTENGKRIGTSFLRSIGGRVLSNSFLQTIFYKERTNYATNIFNGEAENFFGRVINNTPTTIDLNLPAIDFSAANFSFDLTIQGVTPATHQIRVTLNNVEVGTLTASGFASRTQRFDIPTSVLNSGANSLTLQSFGGTSDISLFDNIKINYASRYQARQNQLSFYTKNYKASYLSGFSSPNIRVFDITYPDSPRVFGNLAIEQTTNNGYQVYLPANRGRVMFAVEDSAILAAASITPNSPSALSNVTRSTQLVVISYKDWLTEANNWANYRRSQGMNVEVFNVDDVYDEFSFGAKSREAVKSFLEYTQNSWQTRPGYVLLMGDASYDPRNYRGAGAFNFVPTMMVETIYLETGSDEALADFNNDGLAEIAIGRIPAHTASDITQALNKVSTFEQTVATQGLSRGIIFASDLPDGYDFAGISNRLRSQLPPSVSSIMINRGEPDARTRLINEINNGRFIVNYTGHGNTTAWASSPTFFGSADVANLTNGNRLSIFTMLTCLNGYFIQNLDSLAETLLKKQNGGAVAVWASSGETTPDIQEIMATRFFSQVGGSNTMRLGDLIKDAKTVIPGGRDVRLSWVLLGDPTLKVR